MKKLNLIPLSMIFAWSFAVWALPVRGETREEQVATPVAAVSTKAEVLPAQVSLAKRVVGREGNSWQGLRRAYEVVRLSAGASLIVSEVDTWTGSHQLHWAGDVSAAMFHYWKAGIGAGLAVTYSNTSFDGITTLDEWSVVPMASYSLRTPRRWNFYAGLGIGFSYYRMEERRERQSGSGLAFQSHVGAEYRLTEHVGLGLEANSLTLIFPGESNYYSRSTGIFGFVRLSLLGGVRFYF